METYNTPEFDGCDVVCDKVFSNGLIFRKLEKMLSYSDLKVCRVVCRRFNWSILNETDFCTRTMFLLKDQTCRDKVLKNVGFTLKHLKIYPFHVDPAESPQWQGATARKSPWTEEDVEHIYDKCKDIECLFLVDDCVSIEATMRFYPSVKRIIEGATNLKTLSLCTFDMDYVIRDPGGLEMYWKNLVDIRIAPGANGVELGVSDSILRLRNLKRITIHDGSVSEGWMKERDRFDAVERLATLVTQNNASLEYLYMFEPYLWKISLNARYPCVPKTRFPKLQEAHIRIRDEEAQDVYSFLKTHLKQLDALTLRIIGEFPVSLLNLIQESAAQFKTLNIETKTFAKSMQGKLAFLADCNNLKEFKLQFIPSITYERHGDSWGTVFSYIPTSVRKLSLLRLPNSGTDTLSIAKIQMLSKLGSLKLVGCGNAVTDEILQAIFINMNTLRELEITEARKCTDEGFTGTSDEGTAKDNALAISNLKLLTSLYLRDCGITDRTVKDGIRFVDLIILDISANSGITSTSCNVALANNPALEVLRTDYFEDFGSPADMKSLKENYPRFQEYMIPADGEIEDIDVTDDDEGDGDSDFSGGAMDHAYHDELDEYEDVDDDFDDDNSDDDY